MIRDMCDNVDPPRSARPSLKLARMPKRMPTKMRERAEKREESCR